MSRLPSIMSFFYSSIWAIDEDKFNTIMEFIEARNLGVTASPEMIAAIKRPITQPVTKGAVAVLPVRGTIFPRGSIVTESSGGVSLEAFTGQIKSTMADPGIDTIILDIDSPGGNFAGLQEAASTLMVAKKHKRVVAVVNHLAASAAYFLASQATEIVSSPSGEVGSIGVLAVHRDYTEAEKAEGVKTTVVKAGKYKAEFLGALTDDAIMYLQKKVDDSYSIFVNTVARGRNTDIKTVLDNYGEGRTFTATEALSAGMIDRVATLDDVIIQELANAEEKQKYKNFMRATNA